MIKDEDCVLKLNIAPPSFNHQITVVKNAWEDPCLLDSIIK